jgi:hypothetical protein
MDAAVNFSFLQKRIAKKPNRWLRFGAVAAAFAGPM